MFTWKENAGDADGKTNAEETCMARKRSGLVCLSLGRGFAEEVAPRALNCRRPTLLSKQSLVSFLEVGFIVETIAWPVDVALLEAGAS
ncbi:hypothetical protein CDL15_Pgr017509 [Punica granatum]|uniref:Uncharacterized protein n=1 Tax=Punica granatum TaxID=22663 RepID=A0A218WUT0_PUNGR|nr:hypothetical protein CDL15_Pgr017509 [Punica granatum]